MPPLTLFLNEDVTKLLHNKFVVILGDSIQRGIYKDLVALLQGNEYLSSKDLKAKGEKTFMNDTLMEGGILHNGINYREVRQYRTDFHLVRFYFITRIHNKYWEQIILPDLQGEPVPDVVIMNSCLWDVSRYGRSNPMTTFMRNVETTFSKLNSILPVETLIIWNTALPVSSDIKGGFLLPELQDLSKTMRIDIHLANYYAKELAKRYQIDVLDLNFFFRQQMHRQVGDGIHWNYVAHRRITNLLLAHIAVSWGVGVPRGKDQLKVSSDSLYYDFETEDEKKKGSQSSSEWDDVKKPGNTLGKDKPAASTVRLVDTYKKDEKLPKPADQSKDESRSGSVARVKNEHDGRRSRSPLERDRPPSRVDPGNRSPPRQNTPPLIGGGLPPGLELKPINIGNIPQGSAPSVRSPIRPIRGMMPRAGGRYQPYIPPQQHQPLLRPQTWLPNPAPRPYYPQAQYSIYPNQQPYLNHYPQSNGNVYNPYNVQNLHYDNRMRQRLAAERNMEVVRGLLMEDVFRLQ